MNMRFFAMLGAVACMALTACVVVDNTGSGGSGGDGGSGPGVGGSGGSGGAGGQGGQGGGGGAACTESCAEATQDPNVPFCMTAAGMEAQGLYDPLFTCSCGDMGPCAMLCKDSLCAGMDPSADCAQCVLNKAEPDGCSGAFGACSAN